MNRWGILGMVVLSAFLFACGDDDHKIENKSLLSVWYFGDKTNSDNNSNNGTKLDLSGASLNHKHNYYETNEGIVVVPAAPSADEDGVCPDSNGARPRPLRPVQYDSDMRTQGGDGAPNARPNKEVSVAGNLCIIGTEDSGELHRQVIGRKGTGTVDTYTKTMDKDGPKLVICRQKAFRPGNDEADCETLH
jgi:hypothetical protein